jgi:DNA modification methylase
MLEKNKIICGDSLELIKTLPDKSIDLLVTDPPYGVGWGYDVYDDTPEQLEHMVKVFMPEFLRVAKVTAITTGVSNMFLYPKPTWTMAWSRPAGVGRGPWGFCCWTPILVYGKDPYLATGKGSRPDTYFGKDEFRDAEGKFHPCSKPSKFWRWLIQRCSPNPSDLIMDPFTGSGTTAIICTELGRDFICIELSPEYAAKAQARLDNYQSKKLF